MHCARRTNHRRRTALGAVVVLGLFSASLSTTAVATTKKKKATKATTTTKKVASTPTAAPPTSAVPTTVAKGTVKQGDTLTIARDTAPNSLNPAKANTNPNQTQHLALTYEPLIRINPDLTYSPGLAESWSYDGLNETFTLKLRAGLKFSDGSPLTSAEVVNSMNYFQKNGLSAPQFGSSISGVKATDPLTIVVSQKDSNPTLPRYFSENLLGGSTINPSAVSDPSKMDTASYGAGPYVFDAGASVPGSSYVYVPNKNYFEPTRQYWKKVVIKIVPAGAPQLQAVQTGAVDLANLEGSLFQSAKDSGVIVSKGGAVAVQGMVLADRGGTLNSAIGDVDVRRALNFAIDREAVCKATFRDGGAPTGNFPTLDAVDSDNDKLFPYDEAKAKKLLAEAGYPNGFKLSVEMTAIPPFSIVGQAVVGYWKRIGVDVLIDTNPGVSNSQTVQRDRKYAAYVFGYGFLPSQLVANSFINSATPGVFNPFGTPDAQISDWLNQAPVLPAADASKLYKKAFGKALDQSWVMPICKRVDIYAASKRIDNCQIEDAIFPPYVTLITPA